MFPFDIYKIPRHEKPYIQKRSTPQHRHTTPTPFIHHRLVSCVSCYPSRRASRILPVPCFSSHLISFIAWGVDMRRFPQLILSLSHQGKETAIMAWRFCVSSIGPFIGPCSRLVPPSYVLLVYSCHSKKAVAFLIYPVSPLASCPVPSKPPPRCPLPHSLFAHPSRSHVVSPHRSVLISSRLARCVRTAYRQSCGRAVLSSSSYRSPHDLPSSSSHNRMTYDAGRARIPHHGHAAGQ